MCGENAHRSVCAFGYFGSSPRVRGKPAWATRAGVHSGLIPACAGKTRYGMDSQPLKRAHPRVCGENSFGLLAVAGVVGSSPRVRGKLPPMLRRLLARGLIPACAGKTWNHSQIRCMTRAHPRVCGENIETFGGAATLSGSSPRVRGKLNYGNVRTFVAGLIPACAGKTLGKLAISPRNGAHPRVCGENTERSGVLRIRSVRS